MSAEKDEWRVTYTQYEEVRSSDWDSVKQNYRDELTDSEYAKEAEATYYNLRSEAAERDEQRKRIMSAFLPGNPIAEKYGWEVRGFMPLESLVDPTVDIAVGHPESGAVLAALVLKERQQSQTAFRTLNRAIRMFGKNPRLLREDMNGMSVEPNQIEGSLVASEAGAHRSVDVIESLEEDGEISEQMYLWKIVGTDEERLQAHTDVQDRSVEDTLPGNGLADPLQTGIKVAKDNHSLPDFFVDSHHETIAVNTVGEMVTKRKRDGAQITHFSSADLKSYLSTVLSMSDARDEAEKLAESLLFRWEAMELIESLTPSQTRLDDDSEYFRFTANTQGAKTTMGAVRDNYLELAIELKIEVKAREQTIEDIYEDEGEQSSLSRYFDED